MEHLHSLNPGIAIGDDDAFSMKYIGGLKVCLSFRSVDDVNSFMRVKDDWFEEFYRAIEHQPQFERVTWVKIYGIPVKLWDRRNFESIARKYGRILVPFEASSDARDLSHGRVCVLTESRRRIDDVVPIEFDGKIMNISVLEYEDGWFPLKAPEFAIGVEYQDGDDISDDDSEGISDTVMIEDDVVEIEEGEIVGDEEEKVEDSFPENFAGDVDGKLDEMGEMIGDDSVFVQPFINVVHGNCGLEHDDNQPPRVDFSARECNEKLREEDTESTNNISFGDLKKLIPNGCFGPFNFSKAIHSPSSPIAEIDEPAIVTQEINLNKSPTNPNTSSPLLDPAVVSTPEIIRTARIGHAIGFDIDANNEILIEAMGEVGVCNAIKKAIREWRSVEFSKESSELTKLKETRIVIDKRIDNGDLRDGDLVERARISGRIEEIERLALGIPSESMVAAKSTPGVWSNIARCRIDLRNVNIMVHDVIRRSQTGDGWESDFHKEDFCVALIRSRIDRAPHFVCDGVFPWFNWVPIKVLCFVFAC
ncbi:hypothetical protein L2E82_13648 [Cichorium intybus]|uniref:Uncharacterized protein n=1 Tax=Cichorium intybus TaxID=13427 RepID=A0ACB9EXR3_CICIN|nr:hypothetical protein L2E82_13648 [Cichorium intybus]